MKHAAKIREELLEAINQLKLQNESLVEKHQEEIQLYEQQFLELAEQAKILKGSQVNLIQSLK